MMCCNSGGADSPKRVRGQSACSGRPGPTRRKAPRDPDEDIIQADLERLKVAGLRRAPRPVLVGGLRLSSRGGGGGPSDTFDSLASLPPDQSRRGAGMALPLPGASTKSTAGGSAGLPRGNIPREASVTFKAALTPPPPGHRSNKENEVHDGNNESGSTAVMSPNQSLPHRVPHYMGPTNFEGLSVGGANLRCSNTPKVVHQTGSGRLGATTTSSSSVGIDEHFSDADDEGATTSSLNDSLGGGWNRSYHQQELENEGPLEPVIINVYNLIDTEPNDKLAKVGLGLYHTGVEMYGMEWSYGEAVEETQVSGIFHVTPRTCMNSIRASIIVGCTKLSPEQVDTILRRMENEWKSVDYHVCHHNCNHFASHLLKLLSLGLEKPMELPSWVNRVANGLDYIIPKRLATWFVRKIDGNPPVSVVDPRQGVNISSLPPSVVPKDWYRAHHLAREPKYTLHLDGRFERVPNTPSTPALPLHSTNGRPPVDSAPSTPQHGGKEPPSPTTLAKANFTSATKSKPHHAATRFKTHFDPMQPASPQYSDRGGPPDDGSPVFDRTLSGLDALESPSTRPAMPELSTRPPLAELPSSSPRTGSNLHINNNSERASAVEETKDPASVSASQSYGAAIGELRGLMGISHRQPEGGTTPQDRSLSVSLNPINRNSRFARASGSQLGNSLLNASRDADGDEADSPSAVPRSRAQSAAVPNFGGSFGAPSSPAMTRTSVPDDVDEINNKPRELVGESCVRLSAIPLDGLFESASLTFSSSQKMTLPSPRPIAINPQAEGGPLDEDGVRVEDTPDTADL